MRICEVLCATPAEQQNWKQAQVVKQSFTALATPPVVINPQAAPFGHMLRNSGQNLRPTIQQATAAQSPLPEIQKSKIDGLVGKFTRGEAALQRNVSDDDIVMAMRRVDAAKDAQQRIPKTPYSAAISTANNQPKFHR